MTPLLKCRTLFLAGALLVTLPVSSHALAPVTHRTIKDYRGLIVRGERPELAACMVAALNSVRSDTRFDAVRWYDEDSDNANLQEVESGGHLLRSIQMKVYLRQRIQSFFADPWQRGDVACEQRDEGFPEVRLTVGDR